MQLEQILSAAVAASHVDDVDIDELPSPAVPQASPAVPATSPARISFHQIDSSNVTDISHNSSSFGNFQDSQFNIDKMLSSCLNSARSTNQVDSIKVSTSSDMFDTLKEFSGPLPQMNPHHNEPLTRNNNGSTSFDFYSTEKSVNCSNFTKIGNIPEKPNRESYSPASDMPPCDSLYNVSDAFSLFNIGEDSLVITSQQALAMFENTDEANLTNNTKSMATIENVTKPNDYVKPVEASAFEPQQTMDGVEDVMNGSTSSCGVPAACGEVEIQTSDIIAKASNCLNDTTPIEEPQPMEVANFNSMSAENTLQYTPLTAVSPSISNSNQLMDGTNFTELTDAQSFPTTESANDYLVQELVSGITMSYPNQFTDTNVSTNFERENSNTKTTPKERYKKMNKIANEKKMKYPLKKRNLKVSLADLCDMDTIKLSNGENISKKKLHKILEREMKRKRLKSKMKSEKLKRTSINAIYKQSTMSLHAHKQPEYNPFQTPTNDISNFINNFTGEQIDDISYDKPIMNTNCNETSIQMNTNSEWNIEEMLRTYDTPTVPLTKDFNNGEDHTTFNNSEHMTCNTPLANKTTGENAPIIMSPEEYNNKIQKDDSFRENYTATITNMVQNDTDGDSLKVQLVYLVYPNDNDKSESALKESCLYNYNILDYAPIYNQENKILFNLI